MVALNGVFVVAATNAPFCIDPVGWGGGGEVGSGVNWVLCLMGVRGIEVE